MPLQVQKTVGFARSKSGVFGPVWEHRQYLRLYCIARKGYAGVAASAAVHALNAVSGVMLLLLVRVNKKLLLPVVGYNSLRTYAAHRRGVRWRQDDEIVLCFIRRRV